MNRLDPDWFHSLSEPERSQAAAWLEKVAPDRWTRTIELVDEGRVRVRALLGNRDSAGLPGDVFYDGCGAEILDRAIYTSELPPRFMLEMMFA